VGCLSSALKKWERERSSSTLPFLAKGGVLRQFESSREGEGRKILRIVDKNGKKGKESSAFLESGQGKGGEAISVSPLK